MNGTPSGISRRSFLYGSAATLAAAAVGGCGRAAPTPAGLPATLARADVDSAHLEGNVQVSHDTFPEHLEPSVAVNPRDPRNLLAASRISQGTKLGLVTYASFDAGATWRSNGLLPSLIPDADANATVAFDAHGHGFVCGLLGNENQQGNCMLWRTDDGGRSFQSPIIAAAGYLDHPVLAIDPAPGQSADTMYLAGVYYNTGHDGLVFCRSTDRGRSFEQPRPIDAQTGSQAFIPVIAAGHGGAVHIMYFVPAADGRGGLPKVISSADHGETFATPVTLNAQLDFPPAPAGVITRSGPTIATAPNGSSVYAAVATYDATAGETRILLFSSHDHGRTWNGPTTLARSSQTIYFQPQLAVDDQGTVALSVFALTAGHVDILLFTTQPHQTTVGPPQRITTTSFDPTLAHNARGAYWLGNYQGIAASPDAFHPIWSDTRTGLPEIFTARVARS